MAENQITIKEVVLNNNCPVCYAKGSLLITFKQKVIETNFYKSITPKINYDIFCKNCDSPVYPVQWTDDIERMVEYQQKAFKPMATSTYIKKMSWFIIMSVMIIVVAIIVFLYLA